MATRFLFHSSKMCWKLFFSSLFLPQQLTPPPPPVITIFSNRRFFKGVAFVLSSNSTVIPFPYFLSQFTRFDPKAASWPFCTFPFPLLKRRLDCPQESKKCDPYPPPRPFPLQCPPLTLALPSLRGWSISLLLVKSGTTP